VVSRSQPESEDDCRVCCVGSLLRVRLHTSGSGLKWAITTREDQLLLLSPGQPGHHPDEGLTLSPPPMMTIDDERLQSSKP